MAYHDSLNRKEPTDYKIVTIDMNDLEVNDLVTGWLKEGNVLESRWTLSQTMMLFVSDDDAGEVYRVYYEIRWCKVSVFILPRASFSFQVHPDNFQL